MALDLWSTLLHKSFFYWPQVSHQNISVRLLSSHVVNSFRHLYMALAQPCNNGASWSLHWSSSISCNCIVVSKVSKKSCMSSVSLKGASVRVVVVTYGFIFIDLSLFSSYWDCRCCSINCCWNSIICCWLSLKATIAAANVLISIVGFFLFFCTFSMPSLSDRAKFL